MAEPRVLTQRELNRATLARQLLLRREQLPVPKAVERLCALQAQYSPSPYIALWSRLDGFRRDALTRAFERRQVVKGTLMRITLHIVSARDFLALAPVWRAQRRDEFARHGGDPDAVEAAIRAALADTPLTHGDLSRAFPDTYSWRARSLLALVHLPPGGTWRYYGPAHLAEADRWLEKPLGDPAAGAALLIERYFAAFGPASQTDLLRFAGLRVKDVKPGLDALEARLVRYRSDDGRALLDLARAPLPPGDTTAPVRFLPKWDSTILAYDRRSRILPDEYAKAVIQKNGDVIPTFVVDGFVAGSWDVHRAKTSATLVLRPGAPVPRAAKREVEEEGQRLARWIEPDADAYRIKWS